MESAVQHYSEDPPNCDRNERRIGNITRLLGKERRRNFEIGAKNHPHRLTVLQEQNSDHYAIELERVVQKDGKTTILRHDFKLNVDGALVFHQDQQGIVRENESNLNCNYTQALLEVIDDILTALPTTPTLLK